MAAALAEGGMAVQHAHVRPLTLGFSSPLNLFALQALRCLRGRESQRPTSGGALRNVWALRSGTPTWYQNQRCRD